MLSEESNEFFKDDGIIKKLDAVADFLFVADGTFAKIYAQHIPNMEELKTFNDDKDMLAKYISETKTMIINTLKVQFASEHKNINDKKFVDILAKTYDIVINANMQKLNSKLDANGKVTKPDGFIAPEKQIAAMLESDYKIIIEVD